MGAMAVMDIILDFLYVLIQRRLSSARKLLQTGLAVAGISLGVGSLVGSISFNGFSITADSNSSPIFPILINALFFLGLLFLMAGFLLELYERFLGEASQAHRGKSVDLRSLPKASAPNLSKSFPLTIESSGVHEDLYLYQYNDENLSDWLLRSTTALSRFSKESLARLNEFENEHPLSIGAIAHVPHCFALGFLIANRRQVNYYCWNRDQKKENKSRWIDCRDKRTRGQSIKKNINVIQADSINTPLDVRKLGLSIELSIPSNPENFLNLVGLDAVCQIGLPNQYIGNLFSEKEQVKIISEIRWLLNNELLKNFCNLEELHLTITAQASFIMRFGADLNQNHMPRIIKVHHFDRSIYPWCFILSPNSDNLEFASVAKL